MEDDKEVSKLTYGIVAFAFIAGLLLGYLGAGHNPYTDEQVHYVEKVMSLGKQGRVVPFMTENVTFGNFLYNYEKYKPISTGLLQFEIQRVCSMKEKEIEVLNCSARCTKFCESK